MTSPTSIALSNLRAIVIVIVLAFHSVLAYLASLPVSSNLFDEAPYRWQAIPIIDSHRWFGFDLFCAWQDVSLMALMFFLSGLFVPGSLRRKGSLTYLSDRLFRIGLPMLVVVALLMPIAYYPTYAVHAAAPSAADYWQHLTALPFWPCGPQWFLWELLGLSAVASMLHRISPRWANRFSNLVRDARDNPVRFFGVLCLLSVPAYLPLALTYTPWAWDNIGPLSFQYCRPLLYLVYFFAGYVVGAEGLDRGLLATDGALARNWLRWLGAAVVCFIVWALPTSMMTDGQVAPLPVQLISGLGFVLACASGSFVLLAICLRFAAERTRILDSLSLNAYGMYLLHYVFVVWLQFALLQFELFAVVKAAVVFGGTLLLSWAGSATLCNVALANPFAALKRGAVAGVGAAAPAKLLNRDDLSG